MSLESVGLGAPASWWTTVGAAPGWLAVMLAPSPLANRIATRLVPKPPTLEAFRGIQQSAVKLVAGIALAWVLGAFVEEIQFRGIVVRSVASRLREPLGAPAAAGAAVAAAAIGAGICHLYQGLRAAVIITQLLVLFGVLFVIGGYNLWAVVLCHGLYDTLAIVRFAAGRSRYSNLDGAGADGPS